MKQILFAVLIATIFFAAGCLVPATDKQPDSFQGLYGQWTFEDTSDTVLADASSFSLDGLIHGAQRIVDDGHAALAFDGVDDYVSMNIADGADLSHLAPLGDGTISVWFKLNELPQGKEIFPIFYYGASEACDFFDAANRGLIVEVGHHPVQWESKRLYFTMWANGCTLPSFCFDSNHGIEAGTWYHFAAVVSADHNTGYLNGEEMTARRYNFGTRNDSQFFENALSHETLWLGRGYWDSELNYLNGLIGEIRIYADPLSADDILDLYQSGLNSN